MTTTEAAQTANNAPSAPRPEGLHWSYGVPPTPAQIAAHGGPWARVVGHGPLQVVKPEQWHAVAWWVPKDAAGDNTAWPIIISETRWCFPDGSDCEPHPAAEGMRWVEDEAAPSGWHSGDGQAVWLDGTWTSDSSSDDAWSQADGDTIADQVLAAFGALQAARDPKTDANAPRSIADDPPEDGQWVIAWDYKGRPNAGVWSAPKGGTATLVWSRGTVPISGGYQPGYLVKWRPLPDFWPRVRELASAGERPTAVRVGLTPAQMDRLAACGWDGGDEALAEWLVSRAEGKHAWRLWAAEFDLAARCRAASEATAAAHIAETAARSASRWALEMLRKAEAHERMAEHAQPVDVDGLTLSAEEMAERHMDQAARFRREAVDALAELEGGADSGAHLLLRAFRDGRLVWSRLFDDTVEVGLYTRMGQPQERGEVSQDLADRIVRVLRAEEVADAAE